MVITVEIPLIRITQLRAVVQAIECSIRVLIRIRSDTSGSTSTCATPIDERVAVHHPGTIQGDAAAPTIHIPQIIHCVRIRIIASRPGQCQAASDAGAVVCFTQTEAAAGPRVIAGAGVLIITLHTG